MDYVAIAFSSVITALLFIITIKLWRSLRRFRITKNYTAALDAPSVSVCIPARNETHAMTQCLERVLASDYKKLEVIVYDDSSADDTSLLIRSFAHAGVRFAGGSDLPAGWLGKNHALNVLAHEASGTYIVFIDVDTHITPTTISQIVGYIMTESVDMVSVIPTRSDASRINVLFGHLRYFWELILSTRIYPAASSSLWAIKRDTILSDEGAIEQFKTVVAPESALAAKLRSRYRCLVSNSVLGVSYEKKWRSQVETSKRLLYPKVGGVWWMGGITLFVLFVLNLPTFALIHALFNEWELIHLMALWHTLAFMSVYAVYASRIWRKNWWIGGVLWPVVIFQELVLFANSMYGYMRGKITWKGRSVSATIVSKEADRP